MRRGSKKEVLNAISYIILLVESGRFGKKRDLFRDIQSICREAFLQNHIIYE